MQVRSKHQKTFFFPMVLLMRSINLAFLLFFFFLLCLIKRCTHCQQIRQIQRAFPKQTSLMMTPPCYSRQLLLLLKVTSQQDVFYNNDTATNPLRTRLKVFVRAQIKLKCGSVGFLGRGNRSTRRKSSWRKGENLWLGLTLTLTQT